MTDTWWRDLSPAAQAKLIEDGIAVGEDHHEAYHFTKALQVKLDLRPAHAALLVGIIWGRQGGLLLFFLSSKFSILLLSSTHDVNPDKREKSSQFCPC